HRDLADEDPEKIAKADLPDRHAADDQRGRLRSRVAPRADEERHVVARALDRLEDAVVVAERGLREKLADEEDDEPHTALLDELGEARLEVRHVERLDARELLDVLRLLLGEDVDDVVDGDDPEDHAG